MFYPTEKIDESTDYYALTLVSNDEGRLFIGGWTEWVGWADQDHRIELRKASLIIPDRMAHIWITLEWPFCVVNSGADFIGWYYTGGHALVSKELAQHLVPDALRASPCIQVGELGFVGLSELPKTIFHRAPTAKDRMIVLKRDEYRCRICGRRTTDSTDVELNVHHIRPFGQGGVTHPDNLITLCRTCHRGLDPHYEWSLFNLLPSDKKEDDPARHRNEYLESVRRYRLVMQEHKKLES